MQDKWAHTCFGTCTMALTHSELSAVGISIWHLSRNLSGLPVVCSNNCSQPAQPFCGELAMLALCPGVRIQEEVG